jgi:hypothetical protein
MRKLSKKQAKLTTNSESQKPVYFEGRLFKNEQALHEFRLIIDFDYFMEQAEQNLLITKIY